MRAAHLVELVVLVATALALPLMIVLLAR